MNCIRRCPIALFTATATPDVRKDILNHLEIQLPQTFTRGIERSNLKFSVCEVSVDAEKYPLLDEHLQTANGQRELCMLDAGGRLRRSRYI